MANVPVLLYHNVGPPRERRFPDLTVTPGQFERQMLWLKRNGFQTITAGDFAGWYTGAAKLPRKPILITFDDAYSEMAQNALPILERLNMTATVFVPTAGPTNSMGPVERR
jgi:peptidoglycan/xylan/chitin deacetylase (PgdA/CDA1 family)